MIPKVLGIYNRLMGWHVVEILQSISTREQRKKHFFCAFSSFNAKYAEELKD